MLFVWFYFVTLLALTIAAQSVLENDVALSSFKKLNFSSKALPMQPSTQCVGLNNGDSFVVRGDCQAYLMCWEGEVFEMWCSGGQLFDPQLLICRPENEVQCTDLQRSCPPAGSNELRFLPSDFCDSFYVCVNGRPAPAFCRTGQHWNDIHQFCDDPWTAGCDSDQIVNDCPRGFTGRFPYPHNCNWYVQCNNGRRSVRECGLFQNFDVNQGQCRLRAIAQCANF